MAPPNGSSAHALSVPTSGGDVSIGLLGGFRLRVGSEAVSLPVNAQRLLGFLAIQERAVLRIFVAGSLWSRASERRAGGSLRSALWSIGDQARAVVLAGRRHLQLAPDVAVDLREASATAALLLDPSGVTAEETFDEAGLMLDLLPDWTEDWVLVERERYHQLRLRALEALTEHLTALGRFGQAVQAGIAAVAGEPLRESAHRALIKAHLAAGNTAAALDEYRSFRRLLSDELHLEPSAAMEALVRELTPQ